MMIDLGRLKSGIERLTGCQVEMTLVIWNKRMVLMKLNEPFTMKRNTVPLFNVQPKTLGQYPVMNISEKKDIHQPKESAILNIRIFLLKPWEYSEIPTKEDNETYDLVNREWDSRVSIYDVKKMINLIDDKYYRYIIPVSMFKRNQKQSYVQFFMEFFDEEGATTIYREKEGNIVEVKGAKSIIRIEYIHDDQIKKLYRMPHFLNPYIFDRSEPPRLLEE